MAKKTAGFFADLERLSQGEPLGYLIGFVPFLDCQIWLDSNPLIPRSETEFWVEQAIASIKLKDREVRVLDLCAGSGCVGVAVAKAVPKSKVTFAEIDSVHLPTIAKNLKQNLGEYSNRTEYLKIVESDLFENIEERFDFILTNPPYIDPVLDRTEDSVKKYEPHRALYGGKNGLEIISRIVNKAPEYLLPNGELWIEAEPEQMSDILKLLKESGFNDSKISVDQYGVYRFVVGVWR